MAKPQPYRADPAILALGDGYFDPVAAADFPECRLRFANRRWAARVGLELDDDGWARHFGRFEPLADNLPTPLALRYHGHQFRSYNPDIGDGRGFLFAQLRDDHGRLLDLGTKGSGQTPYSRFGDGRLTLKGGVREVLATEMLEALGVNTSKSFALIETGEHLTRNDEPSPTRSAVLTRLSHGHVRIGSFQRLAYHEDPAGIAALVRYSLENLFDEEAGDDDGANAMRMFALAAEATATLAASYLAAGFVHGVLNSDNINITGESFDYGPWRFAPTWDEAFVAAYFDHQGLYAFGRQPEAIQWDLAQLGGCLALVADGPGLADILGDWSRQFEEALVAALVRRLGIEPDATKDRALVSALLAILRKQAVKIDRFFFDWRGGRVPDGGDERLAGLLGGRTPLPHALDHDYWRDDEPCSMHIDEVEAIWAAIADADDWAPFEAKIASIRRMGDAMTPPCA